MNNICLYPCYQAKKNLILALKNSDVKKKVFRRSLEATDFDFARLRPALEISFL